MVINVHAGHNPDGKIACGAVGLVKESTEARKIKDEVIRFLKDSGCTVYVFNSCKHLASLSIHVSKSIFDTSPPLLALSTGIVF